MTKNITQLPAAAALSGTEVIPAIQAGADVKVTLSALGALGGGFVPDATSATKGKVRLTNHLGGTADAPTVPGLALKADDSAVVKLSGSQTVAGVKTFSTGIVVPNGSMPEASVSGLTAALTAKADDSAVVHNTGNETVAGVKTFSTAPVVPDGSWSIADTSGLQTALDAKAADSAVVHKTGAESIDGVKTFTSAPVVPTGAFARPGQVSVLDYGGIPDAASAVNKPAVLAAFNAASATTYGAELVFPPGVWNVADLGLVWTAGKAVTLVGAGVDATYLYFSTDRAAGTFALSGPGVRVRNMTISGPGTSFVPGTSPANLRGVQMQSRANLQNVVLQGFHAGFQVVGDHTYVQTVKCLNNFYGEEYANATTAGDHTRIDPDLSGNMRASIFIASSGVMDAATYTRGHLGYSPFCIEFGSGGADDWVGMVDSQFLGTAFEYGGNGFFYNVDQKVMIKNCLLDRARPFTGNVAFKIAALAVQPEMYVRTVDHLNISGDGPMTWDCFSIRGCTWEGWRPAYDRAVAAGASFLKANMGVSGLSGTLLLTEANTRAVAFNVLAAVTVGQVVEYTSLPHYVRPHNPSGANGGSMVVGVALTAAPTTGTDVCIVVVEDYEGRTSVQVAGAGPYGANDMLFAVGTTGKVDNAAGVGVGYQDKAIVGRVAGTTTVASGMIPITVKVTDAAT